MIKLSIIIAVYNVEKYIKKCLDSVIKQQGNDIEILIVDDGSTDKSLEICKEYQNKDQRIKIIHQENKGLSHARNIGFSQSTGEYIWHIDGDDYIEDNSVDMIRKYLNKHDIIYFNYYSVKDKIVTKEKDSRFFFNKYDKYILSYSFAWNKVFKRFVFNNNSFPENNRYNDIGIISSLISKTRNIVFIDDCLYYYVSRNSSISNTRKFNLDDYLYCMERVYKPLVKKYPDAAMAYYINHLLLYRYSEQVKFKKKYNYRELNKIVKKRFPKYYKNKYYNLNLPIKIYTRLIYYDMHFLIKILTFFKLEVYNKYIRKYFRIKN